MNCYLHAYPTKDSFKLPSIIKDQQKKLGMRPKSLRKRKATISNPSIDTINNLDKIKDTKQ